MRFREISVFLVRFVCLAGFAVHSRGIDESTAQRQTSSQTPIFCKVKGPIWI